MKPDQQPVERASRSPRLLTLAKLSAIALFIIFANVGVSRLVDALEVQIWPQHLETVDRAVLFGVILYIVLMATPFLPGIELGLVLMIMLGPKGILVTYVCTLIALTLSYSLGRLIPGHILVSFLQWLQQARAAALLSDFNTTAPDERLRFLAERSAKRAIPILMKRRYLVLALLLNLPGNALIGGGGGIAMTAGMSRVYSFPRYFLLISIAILPGAILILLSKNLS